MRIVFKGTDPKELPWGGTCFNCKTIIEAKRGELTIQSCQREGSWATEKCPVCGKEIHLYEKREDWLK